MQEDNSSRTSKDTASEMDEEKAGEGEEDCTQASDAGHSDDSLILEHAAPPCISVER